MRRAVGPRAPHLSFRTIVVIAISTIAVVVGGYALVAGVLYVVTPEPICMEGEQPVWKPATGDLSCSPVGVTPSPGWEVVRVGADGHVPQTRDDPDYKKWQRDVWEPMSDSGPDE